MQDRVLLICGILRHEFLHILGALQQFADVEARHSDRQQAHGGEHRIATAHIVGNHESGIAFLVGEGFQGATGLVGDRCNTFLRTFHAIFLLAVLFQDAECQRWFGRGT